MRHIKIFENYNSYQARFINDDEFEHEVINGKCSINNYEPFTEKEKDLIKNLRNPFLSNRHAYDLAWYENQAEATLHSHFNVSLTISKYKDEYYLITHLRQFKLGPGKEALLIDGKDSFLKLEDIIRDKIYDTYNKQKREN